jgi:hypothetical protein
VVVDERVFIDGTKDVTADDVVADFVGCRVKVPLDISVEGLGVDSTWGRCERCQRAGGRDLRGM